MTQAKNELPLRKNKTEMYRHKAIIYAAMCQIYHHFMQTQNETNVNPSVSH